MGRKKGREYSASGRARLASTDRDVPFRRKRKIWHSSKKISPPREQTAQPSRERPIFSFQVAPVQAPMTV